MLPALELNRKGDFTVEQGGSLSQWHRIEWYSRYAIHDWRWKQRISFDGFTHQKNYDVIDCKQKYITIPRGKFEI